MGKKHPTNKPRDSFIPYSPRNWHSFVIEFNNIKQEIFIVNQNKQKGIKQRAYLIWCGIKEEKGNEAWIHRAGITSEVNKGERIWERMLRVK